MSLEDNLHNAFETYYEAKLELDSDAIRDHPRRHYETLMEESVADIKEIVLDEVKDHWVTVDDLRTSIVDVFNQFPKLTEFYEDHMAEVLDQVKNVYFKIYADQLDMVIKNADHLPHAAIIGIEKIYAMAKEAVEEITGKELKTMVTGDIGNGRERMKDDEFVYGTFFRRILNYIKQKDLPNLQHVPKLDLASDLFEDGYLVVKDSLLRYAKKANLGEEHTAELGGIFETFDSTIRNARTDKKTMKIIRGKKDSLYHSMNQLIDGMIDFPNVKRFSGYLEKMQGFEREYFDHCSKYSRALNISKDGNNPDGVARYSNNHTIVLADKMNAIMKDIKKLYQRIQDNPSTDFLLFNHSPKLARTFY